MMFKKNLPLCLLVAVVPFPAMAASTENSMVESCLGYWKNLMTDETQFDQMQPNIKELCICQTKAVFSANLSDKELAALESFMAGGAPQMADMARAGLVFNQSSNACQKEALGEEQEEGKE